MTEFDPGAEFDRQVQNLLDKGYPALTDMTRDNFMGLVAPLRDVAITGSERRPPSRAHVPFVLVIKDRLINANQLMPMTELKRKAGFSIFEPDDIARFNATHEVQLPERDAYLIFDVDRERETLNLSPEKAVLTITERGKAPITVAEGIAFITQYPDSSEKNNCFSLAASRCGDRRVPALWISKGAPKLGWCWAGNPHTWLRTASCVGRAG
ncbi:MAG: hypothetical protein GEU86_13910 [Actinophytocola sp.]|nr:hypothetical protein [Actinophytocola sp.]